MKFSITGTVRAFRPGYALLRFCLAIVSACLVVGGAACFGGTQFRHDPEYLIETWDTADGMPESSATAMAQTADGYLWFGTFGGLVRFNGVHFQTYSSGDTPGLADGGVVNLYCDSNDRLWVSTVGGLSVMEGQRWRILTEADGWDIEVVRSMAERSNGELLFCGFGGRMLEFRGQRFHALPNPGENGKGAFAYASPDDKWWVVQHAFTGHWDGGSWTPAFESKMLPASAVAGAGARDGGMWLIEGDLLRKFQKGKEVLRTVIPDAPGDYWGLGEDRAGRVWISTGRSGLMRVSADGEVRRWTTSNGLSSDSLRFANEDREGNVWVGTNGGGLQRFTPKRFQTVAIAGAVGPSNFTSVTPRSEGGVWLGSYVHGLSSAGGDGDKAVPVLAGTVPSVVQSVLEDSRGRIWAGCFGAGLTMIAEDGQIRTFEGEETGGTNSLSLYEDSKGRIWTSGGQGVAFFENGEFKVAGAESGLPRGVVTCFGEGPDGNIYLAHEQGLFVWKGSEFAPVSDRDGSALSGVSSLAGDSRSGALWIGTTDRGLLRLKGGVVDSLPASCRFPKKRILGMIDDGMGHLWLMTIPGIVRVGWQDLEAAAEGNPRRIPYSVLDEADGLPGSDFSSGRQPLSARDSEGNLWFPMLRGAAVINPAAFMPDVVPPAVHVEQVSFSAKEPGAPLEREIRVMMPVANGISVPAGSRRLAIHYAALGYAAPEKLRYEVMLEGRENTWRDMQQDRTATFFELPPGHYIFRVRAANRDGVWNENGFRLPFSIQAFYWETLGFKFILGMMLIGIGGGGVWFWNRARHRHLAERLQTEQQRSELAHLSRVVTLSELSGSLAHELNQPLAIILSNAQAAQRILRKEPLDIEEVREILADIVSEDRRAGEVIQRLRALLKRGESHQGLEDLNVLVEEVLMLTRQDLRNRGVTVACDFCEGPVPVNADPIQLQQVILNLITNACDAMATISPDARHLKLVTSMDDQTVKLAVIDQGCGLPAGDLERLFQAFVTTKEHGMGLGLSISRSIVEVHHGSLVAQRHTGRGATFLLTLPIANKV